MTKARRLNCWLAFCFSTSPLYAHAMPRRDILPEQTLGDLKGAMIRVTCDRCKRDGRYRKYNAIRKYGSGS
jgi:hypothetical protein